MLLRSWLAVCIVSTVVCAPELSSEAGRVHAEMRNVVYHYTDSIAVHIIHLEGELVPIGEAGLPVFEDSNSFLVDVHSAELFITTTALANVMNEYAFAASDAPIKAIRVSTQGGKLQIHGRLREKQDFVRERWLARGYTGWRDSCSH